MDWLTGDFLAWVVAGVTLGLAAGLVLWAIGEYQRSRRVRRRRRNRDEREALVAAARRASEEQQYRS